MKPKKCNSDERIRLKKILRKFYHGISGDIELIKTIELSNYKNLSNLFCSIPFSGRVSPFDLKYIIQRYLDEETSIWVLKKCSGVKIHDISTKIIDLLNKNSFLKSFFSSLGVNFYWDYYVSGRDFNGLFLISFQMCITSYNCTSFIRRYHLSIV